MTDTVQFLVQNGYALLFSAMLLHHLGLPIPASPLLLAAGALARTGQLRLETALALCVAAALLGHLGWYEAGRRRGLAVLRLLCRISLEPDTCVRRTEDVFDRQGARTILFAPWIPGLSLVAPPLAGMARMPLGRFLLLDAVANLVWCAAFAGVGFAFGAQLEQAAAFAGQLGGWLLGAVGLAVAGWLGWKTWQRQRVIRDLRVGRITPSELKARLDAGERVLIIDLRSAAEGGETLPGALRIAAEELDARESTIPRDREIILACS